MSILGIDIGPMEIVAGVALGLVIVGRILARRRLTPEQRAMKSVNDAIQAHRSH